LNVLCLSSQCNISHMFERWLATKGEVLTRFVRRHRKLFGSKAMFDELSKLVVSVRVMEEICIRQPQDMR
jgi:hypothetical protein